MVMHARKPSRINDGYFEKHQAHPHPYQKRDNTSSSSAARLQQKSSRSGGGVGGELFGDLSSSSPSGRRQQQQHQQQQHRSSRRRRRRPISSRRSRSRSNHRRKRSSSDTDNSDSDDSADKDDFLHEQHNNNVDDEEEEETPQQLLRSSASNRNVDSYYSLSSRCPTSRDSGGGGGCAGGGSIININNNNNNNSSINHSNNDGDEEVYHHNNRQRRNSRRHSGTRSTVTSSKLSSSRKHNLHQTEIPVSAAAIPVTAASSNYHHRRRHNEHLEVLDVGNLLNLPRKPKRTALPDYSCLNRQPLRVAALDDEDEEAEEEVDSGLLGNMSWSRHCQSRKDDDYRTFKDANAKYSSSKGGYSSSATSDNRYEGRMRDSPNGNSYSPAGGLGLGMGADRDSPRSYSTKPLYKKERENRDYKLSSSRDKYSDCTRSPKDKRSRESRDSEHRTNHDRSSGEILHPIKLSSNSSRESSSQRKPTHNSCQDKRGDERGTIERTARFGDWSEHMSSSGKKYYYNCKTEVSQWEKPREWIVRTESRQRQSNDYSSSRSSHDKHSNSRDSNSKSSSSSSRQSDKRSDYWGSSGMSNRDEISSSRDRDRLDKESVGSSSRDRDRDRDRDSCRDDVVLMASQSQAQAAAAAAAAAQQSAAGHDRQAQDMDISPGDSTPTSETIVTSGPHDSMPQGPVLLANALPRLASHPTSMSQTSGKLNSPTQQHGSNAPGSVSLQNLPRLLSQITGKEQPDAQKALQTIQTAILLSRQSVAGDRNSCAHDIMMPLKVDTSNTTGEGPPTPTHSETQDCLDARKLNSPGGPNSSVQNISSLQSISTLGNLGSLGNGGLQALSRVQPPLTPSLTPSLANHYREDLTQHVRAFPADILEKQAQKLSEEAHTMGSLQCTRVSAELKTARSIVRLTEIQATLQEQRILFLRQQIQTLEELKSLNSFMSDDS